MKGALGGNMFADVVVKPAGVDYFQHKHIGSPKYEDFTVQVGLGGNASLYEWINATWTGKPPAKNGALLSADAQLNIKTRPGRSTRKPRARSQSRQQREAGR